MPSPAIAMDDTIQRALDGSVRALARLITLIESRPGAAQKILSAVINHGGQAHIVGITGPPGAGKSTLVSAVAKGYRQEEKTVAIVAVDPTSPFTGGALLGDRIRMRSLSGDAGIFIRSMASRGQLGGIAAATSAVVQLLDAVGFDVILVETVGAGQAEVDIAASVHTTVVIEAPGMGDDVQSIKAGILEIADILVVNKADRPGASRTANTLKMMLQLANPVSGGHHGHQSVENAHHKLDDAGPSGWHIPVIKTTAITGSGIPECISAIKNHREYLKESGGWLAREERRSRRAFEALLQERLLSRLRASLAADEENQLVEAIARREVDVYTAVDRLLSMIDKQKAAD